MVRCPNSGCSEMVDKSKVNFFDFKMLKNNIHSQYTHNVDLTFIRRRFNVMDCCIDVETMLCAISENSVFAIVGRLLEST